MSKHDESIPSEDGLSSTRQGIWDHDGFAKDMAKAFAFVDGNITQQSLADSFKSFHRRHYAYDWNKGQWFYYSVTQWLPRQSILETIAEWVHWMMQKSKAKEATKVKWQNSANYHGVETILKSLLAEEFDAIVNVVGFTNGYYLDTDTGEIDHLPAFYHVSKYLPEGVNGNYDNISLLFEQTLFDALSHYEREDRFAVMKWMQMWFGSVLSGETHDEAMIFINGPPGTSKSSIVEPIVKAFGDYAASVYGGKVAKDSNSHLEWLARLEGKRLVSISELPDKGQWQTDALNDLISGGRISANRMHQGTKEYTSQAHVIATGNSQPRAAGGSGLWRRIKKIIFDHKPETIDKTLKQRLMGPEQPGIFAWILVGNDMWINQDRQLITPAVIEADVKEYQESSEPVQEFISVKVALGVSGNITAVALYEAYVAWYAQIGDKPVSKRRFGTIIQEAGIPAAVSRKGIRLYQNMQLVGLDK